MSVASRLLKKFYTKSNSKSTISKEKEKEYLEILDSGTTKEKIQVASNPESTDKILEKAFKDSDPSIRAAVARNSSAHDLILVNAMCDDNDRVFNAVIQNENLKPKIIQVALSSLRAGAEAELRKITGKEDKKLWKMQRFLFKGEEEFELELPDLPPEPPENAQFGAPPPNARKVMRIVDYLSRFLKDPRELDKATPVSRRDIMSLFGGKEEVTFSDLVKRLGGKGQAESAIKKLFGEETLKNIKRGETLKKSDINSYIPADKADVRISDIEQRYGEQAVKGNKDEYITFDSANLPRRLEQFWDIHKKNQLASGHPAGFAFSLFTRFNKGKSAVITQIQSDLFSILEDPVKRNMIQYRVPDGRRILSDLENHFSDYKKTWPVFVFRNTYRKLRSEGVEKVYLSTPEGLKKIGASPPLSLIQSVMSKKFASKEGLGGEEVIDVDGVQFPAWGTPSDIVDAEIRESKSNNKKLAERLQSLIIDIENNGKISAGTINTGYGKKDIDPPTIDSTDLEEQPEPKNVEGFDVAQSNYSMQSLFTDAIYASDGGFRFSEELQKVFYVPATIGFSKKANIKKIVEIREENLYNSRSDAVEAITQFCHKKGLKSGSIISVSKTNYGKCRVLGIDSFTIS